MLILLYFFILVICLQLFFYLVIFLKFAFSKPSQSTPKNVSISVIVCAKNEAENAVKFVPLLAEQDYPDYEIILIDDASSDHTLDVFEEFEKKYSNVRLVKVKNNETFWGSKKYALTLGIKVAKNDYLLFTTANCYPATKDWISTMSNQFTKEKTIVLGYGSYEKVTHSFLNKLIRFETLLTAVQYFSWAKIGQPYMGVGRNLAYKKSEFFAVNGFINHIQVRSGDDDLFINQIATKRNTATSFHSGGFTYSKSQPTFKQWFAQKRINTITERLYKKFDRVQLRLFYFSQLLFLVVSSVLLIIQFEWVFVLVLITLRYLATYIIMGFCAGKLKEKDLIYWLPVLEIVFIFTQLNIFFVNLYSKPSYWK
jgi:glycosyltransferase involved in cell wall biosynthesis